MKLEKTKKMLNEYIKKNRESERGRPISDGEISEVRKELKTYERMYKIYTIWTIIVIASILFVMLVLPFIC